MHLSCFFTYLILSKYRLTVTFKEFSYFCLSFGDKFITCRALRLVPYSCDSSAIIGDGIKVYNNNNSKLGNELCDCCNSIADERQQITTTYGNHALSLVSI